MPAHIAFGPFGLDPDRSLLMRNRAPVRIGQRAAVLAALLAARGQVVAKADLMAEAWPEVIVEDGNLTVRSLRRARPWGDAGRAGRIVTVPRLGFRLVVRPMPRWDAVYLSRTEMDHR